MTLTHQPSKSKMNYFHLIIQNIPDLICRFNLNKEIEFMNVAIEKMTGNPASFYIGKSIRDFGFPDDFLQKFDAGFEECLQSGTVIEMRIDRKGGEPGGKHFRINFVPITDNGLQINGLFTVSRDVSHEMQLETEQQKKIEELNLLSKRVINKANKLQNVAYIVTHNLRSSVASSASLTNLYDNASSEAGKDELIEMLKESNKKLGNTLDELSEIIKMNETNELELHEIRFEDVVADIQLGLSPLLNETKAEIKMDFDECNFMMYNKVYLESIIQNLITNAVRYRHPDRNPIISFKTTMVEDGIVFSCSDNGMGIDLNRYGGKIFELHRTFHGNKDARGVGLYITRNQVEALNGTIAVESKVGVGTIFTIHFSPSKN